MFNNIDFLNLMENKGIKYTKQQQDILFHSKESALVLAVPGSGKTTILVSKVGFFLLSKKFKADEILALTFSKTSAMDMSERFSNLFRNEIKDSVEFSTIHSFANFLCKKYNEKYNITENLIKQIDINIFISKSYYQLFKEEISEEQLERYFSLIAYSKNKMLSKSEMMFLEKEKQIKGLVYINEKYEEYKKNNNLYDFDDMLIKAIEILNKHPKTLNYFRNKYKYIMIDEAQDISLLQHEIIRILAYPKNNILIVGDEDQSIYSFRGASPETFLNIKSIYPNIKKFLMDKNFRSDKNIVNISNFIIKQNKKRYEKEIKTEKEKGENIKIFNVLNEKEQLKLISKKIKKSKYNDIGILYRNNINVIAVANYLIGTEDFYVPNYKNGFFKHWIIKDIFNILNILEDKSDINSFLKIYFKFNIYIKKESFKELKNIEKKENFFDKIIMIKSLKSYQIKNIIALKNDFNKARKLPIINALEFILNECGYKKFIKKNAEVHNLNIGNYLDVINTFLFICQECISIQEIHNKINKIEKYLNENSKKKKGRITLTTIHGSKGLEFDQTFLLSINKGVLPANNNRNELNEEDRRLFYVGCTRAKKELNIIASGEESFFIKEILNNNENIEFISFEDKKNDKYKLNIFYNEYLENINFKKNISNRKKENLNLAFVDFKKGDLIRHKLFSKGKIVKIELEKDLIFIRFDKKGIKKLSYSYCINNKKIIHLN